MLTRILALAAAGAAMAGSTVCFATETVSYVYDARGRLVKVVRSGSVNNGVQTDYQHDKADNRVRVKTIGAR